MELGWVEDWVDKVWVRERLSILIYFEPKINYTHA